VPSRKPSIGGNWKMNLDTAGVKDLTAGLIQAIDGSVTDAVDVTVFPPFPYLPPVAGAEHAQRHRREHRAGGA